MVSLGKDGKAMELLADKVMMIGAIVQDYYLGWCIRSSN
jgi:hypothetical protein